MVVIDPFERVDSAAAVQAKLRRRDDYAISTISALLSI
jgi:hypothetical protein